MFDKHLSLDTVTKVLNSLIEVIYFEFDVVMDPEKSYLVHKITDPDKYEASKFI